MGPLTAILTLFAIVGAGVWFQHRLSHGRGWSPLWLAFSTTFTAAVCLISGLIGFRLDHNTAFLAADRWSDSVIWPSIALGLVFAALAAIFWRLAIRETDRLLNRA
jgi:hypothetical protein